MTIKNPQEEYLQQKESAIILINKWHLIENKPKLK
jgi:hypothetical protein